MKYLIPLLLMFAWMPAADAQTTKPSGSLESRVGRLEGVVEQIDKRLTNIEQDQREMLKRMEAMRRDMEAMNSELRGEMNSMRSELQSEINTSFRWLVGIIVTLFLGNVGVHWYWNRKNASAEVPGPVPHSAESHPAARPVVDRPLVAEEETPAS